MSGLILSSFSNGSCGKNGKRVQRVGGGFQFSDSSDELLRSLIDMADPETVEVRCPDAVVRFFGSPALRSLSQLQEFTISSRSG